MDQPTSDKFTLEVCIDNLASAKAAIDGGADRLEVCSALSVGGLTPTKGLLISIRDYLKTKDNSVHLAAMIRCRPGDFVYSSDEIKLMISEIQDLHDACDSFVFGCLEVTDDGEIIPDKGQCNVLLSVCGSKSATFHRAIDVTTNLLDTCGILVSLGFKRVLTSGGAGTASEGINTIKRLQDSYGSKITIMAGSGVKASNVNQIYDQTKIFDYHSSCSSEYVSPIAATCGKIFPSGVAKWQVTDKKKVIEMRKLIDDIESNRKLCNY